MELRGFLLMLVVAAIVGVIAEILVPARMPGGLAGAIVAGLLGSWLGGWLFAVLMGTASVGPVVQGIALIPAVVGAVIVVFLLGLITSANPDRY